jgi:hypothetical protein
MLLATVVEARNTSPRRVPSNQQGHPALLGKPAVAPIGNKIFSWFFMNRLRGARDYVFEPGVHVGVSRSSQEIYDELLVMRCRRREVAAWDELVRRWSDRVLYYLRRLIDHEQDALNALQEVSLQAIALVSLAIAALCGYLAVTQTGLPVVARVGLGIGTLFGLASTVMLVSVLRRGAMNLKIDNRRIAAAVWVFTVLLMTCFLMLGMSIEDRVMGVLMIVYGLTFLICAGVFLLAYRIEQAEFNVREKLLELELRLAELGEKG